MGTYIHILDAFGCVGGNATSFAKDFDAVTTVEIDPSRHAMLVNNVNVALGPRLSSRVKCVCGDAFSQIQCLEANIVYFDPPWGGTDYSSSEKISDFDVPSSRPEEQNSNSTDALPSQAETGADNLANAHNLRAMICLAASSQKDLVVLRLPKNFDIDALARWSVSTPRRDDGLIGDEGGSCQDRPLPFQIRIGHKAVLFVLALPRSRTSAAHVRLSFGLHNLDEMINMLRGLDQDFLHEFHPKFFDWEADRWIRLKSWKGVKRAPSHLLN